MRLSYLGFLAPIVAAMPQVVRNVGVDLSADIQGTVLVCQDDNWGGLCAKFHGASAQCVDFSSEFNDDISSFGPDSGQDCFIFVNQNCTGRSDGPIRQPGIATLSSIGFNNVISSFACFYGPTPSGSR